MSERATVPRSWNVPHYPCAFADGTGCFDLLLIDVVLILACLLLYVLFKGGTFHVNLAGRQAQRWNGRSTKTTGMRDGLR